MTAKLRWHKNTLSRYIG